MAETTIKQGFIDLTAQAAAQIQAQLPPAAGTALRVAARRLEDGAFHYALGFDAAERSGDVRQTVADVPLVVDAASLALVRGMTIDFVELEAGTKQFIFLNPNDPAYVPPQESAP